MNRKTVLAASTQCSVNIHIVSRIVDRSFKLGPAERTMFVKMMRKYEDFSGVEVRNFAILSNHVHLLVKVPPKNDDEMDDVEFLRRLSVIYEVDHMQGIERLLKECRKNHATKAARELKESYTYRMGDISEFMKSLKQKFARWYNKEHSRPGTFWDGRYSLTLVGEGHATKVVAAYIDLNPLRAGMVKDPADYRWSSYGEAVEGKALAKKHLFSVMCSVEPGANDEFIAPENEQEALTQYRMLLAYEGIADDSDVQPALGQKASTRKKRAKGFSSQEAAKIIKRGGSLTLSQMLRCKVRYLTSGFAIGSESFVNEVVAVIKKETGVFKDRKSTASKIKHGGASHIPGSSAIEPSGNLAGSARAGHALSERQLYSLRNIQKSPVQAE